MRMAKLLGPARGPLVGIAVGAMTLISAVPALAIDISACPSTARLELRPDEDIIITAPDPDATYEATHAVRIYCVQKNGTEDIVTGASITVTTFDDPGVPFAEFEIQPEQGAAYIPSNLALVLLTDANQDGYYTFSLRSNTDDLASGPTPVDVGAYLQFTWGGGNFTGEGANILASVNTPELSSIALFGSGATGMMGYLLARRRAGKRRDH